MIGRSIIAGQGGEGPAGVDLHPGGPHPSSRQDKPGIFFVNVREINIFYLLYGAELSKFLWWKDMIYQHQAILYQILNVI